MLLLLKTAGIISSTTYNKKIEIALETKIDYTSLFGPKSAANSHFFVDSRGNTILNTQYEQGTTCGKVSAGQQRVD